MNWKIANLERTLPSGVVFNIHYTVDKVDGEFSAGAYGSIGVAGDPAQSGFIAFDSLTESDVIGWVIGALGSQKVAEIEAALDAQIEKQKNPVAASGLPWSN